ncbi:MAG: 1-deoxy-D-xylulose-5-phosphate synthase [Clostridiales bacterium]|nr:1-deoxy-D-xylulose-5-phosphate synthase [Clostridiales bacterium]
MTNLLNSKKFPNDIKTLSNNETEELGKEIREFLIESVSKTGGHLASNLGIVELTLSIFKSFDIGKDKIIYDVGHQSYVHKILTGRKDKFHKLRQKDGISGFPKRNESEYDYFDTGHSSTSISAALGMARARDIKGEDYSVIAVIGDGALTGGMAYEALNDVGFKKTKLIIILNDNQMSISKNVGGLSKYLNDLRMEPKYNEIKNNINTTLKNSRYGKGLIKPLTKIKDSIKQLVVPSMLFEDMGLKYVGPIDGHDINKMNEVFKKAKAIDGPVIIHVITQKGRGYELAEKSPQTYHGVSPFNLECGIKLGEDTVDYSSEFGKVMTAVGRENKNVVAVTAAMPDGTGLKDFAKEFPKRFFDVGIAEEHAVTLCAGMTCGGLKPVFAVYSTFLQRAYDQVLHDVCIQNLPVVFAIDRAGVVGADGETHQGIMDISYLSMIPNMTIIAPKCVKEMDILIRYAINHNGPIAIRYPKGTDTISNIKPITKIKYGKWEIINSGEKVAIIGTGKMIQNIIMANEKLKEEGINCTIINAIFIKPIDKELIKTLAENNYKILTVEDNMHSGGLGSMILDELNKCGYIDKIKILAYEDTFVSQGKIEELYEENGLDMGNIINEVKKLLI